MIKVEQMLRRDECFWLIDPEWPKLCREDAIITARLKNKAMMSITLSCSDSIMRICSKINCPKRLWDYLSDTYQVQNNAHRLHLKNKLQNLSMSEDTPIIKFVAQRTDNVRYSILVKQYALTDKAFQYLQILKKNTENLGSIFDAQPTRLTGNIHSVKNPAEVVIGYFNASSVTEKRIFIDNSEVSNWHYVYPGQECDLIVIEQNSLNYLLYDYPDPQYSAYYFSGRTGLAINRISCLDCTLQGGTNQKPSYW